MMMEKGVKNPTCPYGPSTFSPFFHFFGTLGTFYSHPISSYFTLVHILATPFHASPCPHRQAAINSDVFFPAQFLLIISSH